LKNYFGEFEILVNNYLGREDVFSILPIKPPRLSEAPLQRGELHTAKNFVFEIKDEKIANISNL
jgi:hypothetical protein